MATSTAAAARTAAPSAFFHLGAARLIELRSTTPGRLRIARVLLVFILLLTAAVAAHSARVRADAARDIQTRTEPVSSAALEGYGALADADLTFVSNHLLGSAASGADRKRFEDAIVAAAASLASAGIQSGGRGLDAERISDLTAALPGYAAAVERSRAGRNDAAGAADVQRASDLMQSTILRLAEALQRDQSERLDDEYRRAGATPKLLLAFGAASFAALLIVQLLLLRRTKRMLNLGLVAASAGLLGMGLWWAVAFSISQGRLDGSQRHSQSATDALGQAQVAARQGRASEILALVADPASAAAYAEQLSARSMRLLRDGGAGGALGAAGELASDPGGSARVQEAIRQAEAWMASQDHVQALRDADRHDEAVAFALGPAAAAFAALDTSLSQAADAERTAFQQDITGARRALKGLGAGTALFLLAAAAAAARGIGTRLEEYR